MVYICSYVMCLPSLSTISMVAFSGVRFTPALKLVLSVLRERVNVSFDSMRASSLIVMLEHTFSCPLWIVNSWGSGVLS